MGSEIDAVGVFKKTFNAWKDDIQTYLMPSLEFMVDLFIYMMIVMVFFIPIYLIITIPMTINSGNGDLDPIFLIIYLTSTLIGNVLGMLFRSLLDGGMVTTMRSIRQGNKYRFFDLMRNGWKNKGLFLRLEISSWMVNNLIMIGFCLIPLIFIIPLLILFWGNIVLLLILLLFFLIWIILLIPLSIFLIPLTFLTFTYNLREGTGGIASVGKALSFMRQNKKQTFILGGIFYIGAMVGSSIPFLGMIVAAAANLFMYDMILEIIPPKYE